VPLVVINGVQFPEDKLAEFCRRHGIKRLTVVGGILGKEFGPASEVEMQAEFEAGRAPVDGLGGMTRELGELVGRRVDLRAPLTSPGAAP
jgi:uncharacterized protein